VVTYSGILSSGPDGGRRHIDVGAPQKAKKTNSTESERMLRGKCKERVRKRDVRFATRGILYDQSETAFGFVCSSNMVSLACARNMNLPALSSVIE
jgi:hypothetical protein